MKALALLALLLSSIVPSGDPITNWNETLEANGLTRVEEPL